MRNIVLRLVAIFFPWVTFLYYDNPSSAVVALLMQSTIIGWPFAAAWAWGVEKEERLNRKEEKKKKKTVVPVDEE